MNRLAATVALLASVTLSLPTAAQEARADDVASVDAIMKAYYEVVSGPAGAAPDIARDRSLHHPAAWVAIAGKDSAGTPRVRVMTLAKYHGTNAPRREGFFEWETNRTVTRSGNMIHVWSSYASARTPGGQPFARGVNSVTLFYDGVRYWVMGWMFDGSVE